MTGENHKTKQCSVINNVVRTQNKIAFILNTMINVHPADYDLTDKCRRLISLARKYNILLLCDDVYNILHWDATQPPPKRLLQYDK